MIVVFVKEKSLLAKIAAKKLKSKQMAMVLGHTIYLYGISKEAFLANKKWLRHELKHVEQFKKNGVFLFLLKYLWTSTIHGYYNCFFEKEARSAEADTQICNRFIFKISGS